MRIIAFIIDPFTIRDIRVHVDEIARWVCFAFSLLWYSSNGLKSLLAISPAASSLVSCVINDEGEVSAQLTATRGSHGPATSPAPTPPR